MVILIMVILPKKEKDRFKRNTSLLMKEIKVKKILKKKIKQLKMKKKIGKDLIRFNMN
jgi:hypothetical protein